MKKARLQQREPTQTSLIEAARGGTQLAGNLRELCKC